MFKSEILPERACRRTRNTLEAYAGNNESFTDYFGSPSYPGAAPVLLYTLMSETDKLSCHIKAGNTSARVRGSGEKFSKLKKKRKKKGTR